MCNAVKNNDFSGLYSMTSSSFKVAYSKDEMVTKLRGALNSLSAAAGDYGNSVYGNVIGCSVEAVSIITNNNGTEAEGRISWSFSDQVTTSDTSALVAENGAWKVSVIVSRMSVQ